MASNDDIDLGQLEPNQLDALAQYTDVTSQEPKDAIPLLQRSQWNVQVRRPVIRPLARTGKYADRQDSPL